MLFDAKPQSCLQDEAFGFFCDFLPSLRFAFAAARAFERASFAARISFGAVVRRCLIRVGMRAFGIGVRSSVVGLFGAEGEVEVALVLGLDFGGFRSASLKELEPTMYGETTRGTESMRGARTVSVSTGSLRVCAYGKSRLGFRWNENQRQRTLNRITAALRTSRVLASSISDPLGRGTSLQYWPGPWAPLLELRAPTRWSMWWTSSGGETSCRQTSTNHGRK